MDNLVKAELELQSFVSNLKVLKTSSYHHLDNSMSSEEYQDYICGVISNMELFELKINEILAIMKDNKKAN